VWLTFSLENQNSDWVKEVIHENHQLTVQEVEEVEVSNGSCHTILMKDLGVHWVSAKFVPRFLTDDWKHLYENFLQKAKRTNIF
jgi:hypothetical protein